MSRYPDTDTSFQAGDWLAGAARRNPEALLLLAAGACLLMRSRGSSSSRSPARSQYRDIDHGQQSGSGRISSSAGRTASNLREGISRAADSAADYASDIKERVSDTASAYADSVSEFAQDTRRTVSERSSRLGRQAQSTLQDGVERVLRDQPLAVAVAGLAAGAAVAALFPSTEVEGRTLGGAREALTGAAGKAGEMVMDAAEKARERLRAQPTNAVSARQVLKGWRAKSPRPSPVRWPASPTALPPFRRVRRPGPPRPKAVTVPTRASREPARSGHELEALTFRGRTTSRDGATDE